MRKRKVAEENAVECEDETNEPVEALEPSEEPLVKRRSNSVDEGALDSLTDQHVSNADSVTLENAEWLSFEYSGRTFFVHPPSRRVCDEPDGTTIGEFDEEAGEVTLIAEDAEAAGAQSLQRCSAADELLLRNPAYIDAFVSTGLLSFTGYAGVGKSLLRQGLLEGLQAELEILLAAGNFSNFHTQSSSVRTDRNVYLCLGGAQPDGEDLDELLEAIPCPPLCLEAIQALEGVVAVIEERHQFGLLRPRRCMAACYETGGFYTAHRDNSFNPATNTWVNSRGVTAILYANDANWPPERGGSLRCYVGASAEDVDGTTASKIVDVFPSGGQAVIFDSKKLLHEVMPTSVRRLALTVWFVAGAQSKSKT